MIGITAISEGAAVSGLREQQKEMRRQAIAQSGIELFNRQGYASTTVEQIAKAAGVSVPTVFKYYGSKQEILLEMLKEADRRAILDTRSVDLAAGDPVDVLCELESRIVGYALEIFPAALWRELLPLVLSGGSEGLPEAYRQLNADLQGQIAQVLAELQRIGKLRPDLDVKLAAFMLNDYSHVQLLRLTSTDELDMEGHRQQVRRITQFIFDGMRNSPADG